MHVLLLQGGNSGEREVSLRSGATINKALDQLGYRVTLADPADTLFDLKKMTANVDVVFSALHGHGGEDGVLQQALEELGVAYTGSGPEASALCFDKWLYKQFLHVAKLPVAEGQLVSLHRFDQSLFLKPYVLKPCDEGSSLDTQIVRQPTAKTKAVSLRLLETHTEMLLEQLIVGTEITVGIFDKTPLPVIEIVPPKGREFDYANKYNGKTQELCPPKHVTVSLQKQAQALALHIHNITGCRDMSRTDIMIDKDNNLFVLETNTIPGLTHQSLLPKMLQQAGITMPAFVDQLLKLALSR
jgi:D-alanine-D-alanine ligase